MRARFWIVTALSALLIVPLTLVSASAYTPPTASPFTDVRTNHTFYSEIAWLADQGISTGYGTAPRRTFQPSAPVLREQMAAFMYRLAGKPSYTAPARSPFTDVTTRHTFYKEIAWLAAEGISTGYRNPNGTWSFRPGQPVLREQMAAFMYRFEGGTAHQNQAPPRVTRFDDVSYNHAFVTEMNWLAEWGISTGYPSPRPGWDPDFRPSQPVLREQMAAFMYRLATTLPITPPVIDLPAAGLLVQGEEYLIPLSAVDGRAGTWSVDTAALPPGVVFEPDYYGLALIGSPSAVGEFTVTVGFTDLRGATTQHDLQLEVVQPDDTVTKADITVALHWCAGEPAADLPAQNPFTDLAQDDPDYPAAIWALETGLFTSPDDEPFPFQPHSSVTHAQFARLLHAFSGSPAYTPPFHSPFIDVPNTHAYYRYIAWGASAGLLIGEQTGHFHPERVLSWDLVETVPLECVGE